MRTVSSNKFFVGLALAVVAPVLVGTFARTLAGANPGTSAISLITDAQAEATFADKYCKTTVKTAVPSGSAAEARLYYRDLTKKLALPLQEAGSNSPGTTLDDVIVYLGFGPKSGTPRLTAKDLQDAAPNDLMNPEVLGSRLGGSALSLGDVLVARFFAPKVSDVSQLPVTLAGWRKLVRFRAQRGSGAATRGIAYGIVLFNFFAPLDATNPFTDNDSVNTQVILVGNDARRSLSWIDFGKTSEGAKLSLALNAFFDAGHVPAFAGLPSGAAQYFVPCSCISCHGGLREDFSISPPAPQNHFTEAVLDYLDTDHWQDRVAKGDDFEGLKAPVLFDEGAFGVILLLNLEIQQQNVAAQPDSVLRRGAEHWVTSHVARGATPEPLFDRALRQSSKARRWNQDDPVDAELLPKLSRFCFRCHGSVLFDVMDKDMVVAMTSKLNAALFPRDQIVDKRVAMPPDRTLQKEDFDRLRELILKLQ